MTDKQAETPRWAVEAAKLVYGRCSLPMRDYGSGHKRVMKMDELARIIAEAVPKRQVITEEQAKEMECPWTPWDAWDTATQAEVVGFLVVCECNCIEATSGSAMVCRRCTLLTKLKAKK